MIEYAELPYSSQVLHLRNYFLYAREEDVARTEPLPNIHASLDPPHELVGAQANDHFLQVAAKQIRPPAAHIIEENHARLKRELEDLPLAVKGSDQKLSWLGLSAISHYQFGLRTHCPNGWRCGARY